MIMHLNDIDKRALSLACYVGYDDECVLMHDGRTFRLSNHPKALLGTSIRNRKYSSKKHGPVQAGPVYLGISKNTRGRTKEQLLSKCWSLEGCPDCGSDIYQGTVSENGRSCKTQSSKALTSFKNM